MVTAPSKDLFRTARCAADDARLTQIVSDCAPAVWRFLRRLGVPEADVDDAVQEVVLVAARKLDAIAVGSERAFLLSCAFHVARRMRHVNARKAELGDEQLAELAHHGPGPDSVLDEKQARVLLDEILLRLPVDLRTVFVLFEFEELTVASIAALLEIPAGTASSRLPRAREEFDQHVARVEARIRFNEARR